MSLKYKLPSGYSIREIESADFGKLWAKPAKKFFNDKSLIYDRDLVHSKKEQRQFKALHEIFNSKQHVRINLGLYYKDKFVGWSWGFQENPTVFYMCNSAVFENHRKKGLYTDTLHTI